MRDPYQVLGVQKGADAAAIKSAYRKLAKKLHPDANKDDPKAATRFSELNTAYEILGDEAKRKQFDAGEIDAEGKPKFTGFGGGFGGQPGGGFGQHPGGGFGAGEACSRHSASARKGCGAAAAVVGRRGGPGWRQLRGYSQGHVRRRGSGGAAQVAADRLWRLCRRGFRRPRRAATCRRR